MRKVEEKLKPYLYEGPLSSHFGFVEQKTKAKREHIALGIYFIIII